MSTDTVSTFPVIDSRSQKYNSKISVLSAINKLKQTEYRLVQASNRQVVQKRLDEVLRAKQYGKRKSEYFRQAVRKSIEMDKSMRQKSLQRERKEMEKLHQLASSFRETKQGFRQQINQTQKQQNQKAYQMAISQRVRNQQLIIEFKQRQMQLKQANRQKLAEKIQKSRQKVKSFRDSRIEEIKKSRQKDVEDLQRRIRAKSRYLQRLNSGSESRLLNEGRKSVSWRDRSVVAQKQQQSVQGKENCEQINLISK